MKKKMLKRIVAPLMAFAVVVSMIAVPQQAKADSIGDQQEIKYGKKSTFYLTAPGDYVLINMGKKGVKAKDITVKSSNKKVLVKDKDFGTVADGKKLYPVVRVKKPGKTVLTIKVKKKHSVKKYKCRLTVKKYKSPMKKVTLEGKSLTAQFKDGTFASHKRVGSKGKISIKVKKGWKVKKIDYHYYNSKGSARTKKVKNNSTVKLQDGASFNYVLYNKKQNSLIKGQIFIEEVVNDNVDPLE